jgi:hypothetical protein
MVGREWRGVLLLLTTFLLSSTALAYEPYSPAPVTLAVSGSNFTPDCSVNGFSNNFIITLTANSQTLANPTNCPAGTSLVVTINQGAGSGFTGFATGTQYKFAGGVTPPWSVVLGKKDVISCNSDTTTTYNCTASIASGG